jgi:peptidyl-tRNA hydrolase, PTH1 family
VLGFLRRLFAPAPSDQLAGLDSARLRLIVGLGNPGPEYAATRHNLGFRCVEELARRCGANWRSHDRATCLVAQGTAGELALVLSKPQTYMNRSGDAVRRLVERLDLPLDRVLIVYDDMDLPFGTLRLRERGSPGTHNGMRSVVAALQSEDVPRLRIGISQAAPGEATDHVLSEFSADEEQEAEQLVGRATDAALAWATESAVVAMNRYNRS